MQQHSDVAQGIAGAATTAAGVGVTWIEQANALVDLGAGIVAIVAGIFTCVWTYHKIQEIRSRD